jgi:hypothetical protein
MIRKPMASQRAVHDFSSEPVTLEYLRRFIRGTTAAKRVEHDISLLRRDFDTAARNHRFEFVDVPA